MKKLSIAFAITLLSTVIFSFSILETSTYKIDVAQSELSWLGKKVVGQHNGKINLKGGELVLADGVLQGGQFEIDMSSITCEDLQGEWSEKLVGHLHSDDFFGTANHPTSQLTITEVNQKSDGTYAVTADLTIKGTTKPVTFDAVVNNEGDQVKATATIEVDRTKYGIKYNSGSFFDGLGDKMIEDIFTLSVEITGTSAM